MNTVTTYKPGQLVPVSGIYDVVHAGPPTSHHPLHQVTCVKNEPFPPCRKCGSGVVFGLYKETAHLNNASYPLITDHEMFK